LRGDVYLDPTSLATSAGRPRLLPLGSRALGDGHTDDIGEDGKPIIDAEPAPVALVASAPAGVSGLAAMGALAGIRG
jgi:hypothetical protein